MKPIPPFLSKERPISEAEYNKRLDSVKFKVEHGYCGWTVVAASGEPLFDTRISPIAFYINGNKIKADAVCGFLNALPLLELDSFLRAKYVGFDAWLDGKD